MDILIRKAEKRDMPRVLELITELAVYENEPDAVQISVDDLITGGFGPTPQFTCFVASVNDKIVGMALVYFRFSTWAGNTVHLEDLIVTQEMRGKGVGNLLYSRVMQFAKDQGVKRVNWMVLGWNKGAIKFYERTGANVMEEWWQVEMDADGIDQFLKNQ